MRKAQSALEYLMTYGWAILIIVIVGGALYALDVFSPATTKVCSGFGTIVYKDHKITSTGNLTIKLNAPAIGGDVTSGDVKCGDGDYNGSKVSIPTTGVVMTMGECHTGTKTVGDSYSGVTVTVKYTQNEIEHTDSATCMGQYE